MRVASWNVNSIKARLPNVLDWLGKVQPDVLLMQEIKCQDGDFPALEFESLGYKAVAHGQKSYNGVAVVSRLPIQAARPVLPKLQDSDPDDPQARYLEVEINGVILGNLYLPNGNPRPGDKYTYKLDWMQRLHKHAAKLLDGDMPFLLAGDYNICPTDRDVYDPAGWAEDALCYIDSRKAYRAILNLGLTEAWRSLHPNIQDYTFWDYQAGAWFKNHGLRIDHFLLSPALADRLESCEIDRAPRGLEKASDHTPIVCMIGG